MHLFVHLQLIPPFLISKSNLNFHRPLPPGNIYIPRFILLLILLCFEKSFPRLLISYSIWPLVFWITTIFGRSANWPAATTTFLEMSSLWFFHISLGIGFSFSRQAWLHWLCSLFFFLLNGLSVLLAFLFVDLDDISCFFVC